MKVVYGPPLLGHFFPTLRGPRLSLPEAAPDYISSRNFHNHRISTHSFLDLQPPSHLLCIHFFHTIPSSPSLSLSLSPSESRGFGCDLLLYEALLNFIFSSPLHISLLRLNSSHDRRLVNSSTIVLLGCVDAEALNSIDHVSLFETSLPLPCLTLSSGRPRCH